MRQFILGNQNGPLGAVDASTAYGSVGLAYLDKSDNKIKFCVNGTELVDGEGYVVLVRQNEQMGNVVLPFHKNHLSYVHGVYDDTKSGYYAAQFTVTDVDPFLDYTAIVVKKGILRL